MTLLGMRPIYKINGSQLACMHVAHAWHWPRAENTLQWTRYPVVQHVWLGWRTRLNCWPKKPSFKLSLKLQMTAILTDWTGPELFTSSQWIQACYDSLTSAKFAGLCQTWAVSINQETDTGISGQKSFRSCLKFSFGHIYIYIYIY